MGNELPYPNIVALQQTNKAILCEACFAEAILFGVDDVVGSQAKICSIECGSVEYRST